MTIEDQVRDMLRERALDVAPSPPAWDVVEGREVARHTGRRARAAVALAVAAALVVTVLVVGRGTDSAGDRQVLADGPAVLPAGRIAAVWPTTFGEELAHLLEERPELADPSSTALAYLWNEGVVPTPPFDTEVDGDEATVVLRAPTPGTVSLRRLGGDGGPWYVTGATSDLVQVSDVTVHDRPRKVSAEVVVGADGTFSDELRWADGGGSLVFDYARPVAADEDLVFDNVFLGRDWSRPLVFQARLVTPDGTGVSSVLVWSSLFAPPFDQPQLPVSYDPDDDDFDGVWPSLDGVPTSGRASEFPDKVAASFLADVLGDITFEVQEVRQEGRLAEVSYQAGVPSGARGAIQLRLLGSLWIVVGASAPDLEILDTARRTVYIRSSGSGTVRVVVRRSWEPGSDHHDVVPVNAGIESYLTVAVPVSSKPMAVIAVVTRPDGSVVVAAARARAHSK